ncbi:MAG: helix-turn-helix domain-containing protein [Candidatus Ancillula sp.]|nr:helix-turn-helix domain-containing protein [Candidatus Ancillula sp.]
MNVWAYGYTLEDISLSEHRKLDVHICTIRKKIKEVDKEVSEYIVTEHCYGYRLVD